LATYELPVMGRLLRISEAADVLGVAEKTIRAWVAQGKIDSVKHGRNRRIPESAVRERVIIGLKRGKSA
jgi:excisionase family DNA binding protein